MKCLRLRMHLQGARDIIAEWINEDEKARNNVRFSFKKGATIRSKVARGKDTEGAKYKDYFDFEEPSKKSVLPTDCSPLEEAKKKEYYVFSITPDEEDTIFHLEKHFLKGYGKATEQVKEALTDCYKRLLSPSIETEFRNLSKEKADKEAIDVFAENLRQLLLAAPLGQKRVLAIDPGFRTGCKVVCLDQSGTLLHHTAIFPHPPQAKEYEAIHQLESLAERLSN